MTVPPAAHILFVVLFLGFVLLFAIANWKGWRSP